MRRISPLLWDRLKDQIDGYLHGLCISGSIYRMMDSYGGVLYCQEVHTSSISIASNYSLPSQTVTAKMQLGQRFTLGVFTCICCQSDQRYP
ncbi:hypothetical protein V8C42DRAFT_252500 [Trichoderma barbatum]